MPWSWRCLMTVNEGLRHKDVLFAVIVCSWNKKWIVSVDQIFVDAFSRKGFLDLPSVWEKARLFLRKLHWLSLIRGDLKGKTNTSAEIFEDRTLRHEERRVQTTHMRQTREYCRFCVHKKRERMCDLVSVFPLNETMKQDWSGKRCNDRGLRVSSHLCSLWPSVVLASVT